MEDEEEGEGRRQFVGGSSLAWAGGGEKRLRPSVALQDRQKRGGGGQVQTLPTLAISIKGLNNTDSIHHPTCALFACSSLLPPTWGKK